MFSIHAATGADTVRQLVDVVGQELVAVAGTRPDLREVDRSRAQLKAGLLMSFESSGARVEQIARQMLIHDRVIPAQELIDRVEAVTAEDVRAFAERLVAQKTPTAIVVGAGRKSRALAEHAARQFTQPEAA